MLGSLQGILIANIWNNHYGWSPVIFEHYVIICMMRLIMRGRRRRMLMIRKFTFAWPHNQNYLTQSKKQSQPLCRNHYQCHWTLGQTLKYKLSCNGQCGTIIIIIEALWYFALSQPLPHYHPNIQDNISRILKGWFSEVGSIENLR